MPGQFFYINIDFIRPPATISIIVHWEVLNLVNKWRNFDAKDTLFHKSNLATGKGNPNEKPTTPFTDRNKWTGCTLIKFKGKPGYKIHACFSDVFKKMMILDGPLIMDENGEVIVVFSRGHEDCTFFGVSENPITAELLGYGTQV